MKILLCLFILFNFPFLASSNEAKLKSGFDKYTIVYEDNNDDFGLCLYKGVIKDKTLYGLYFDTYSNVSYKILLKNDMGKDYYFDLEKDAPTLFFEVKEKGQLLIVDKNDNTVYLRDDIIIEPFSKEELFESEILLNGGGIIDNYISVSYSANFLSGNELFVSICICIIFISSLTIAIFYIRKKGKFNPDIRKENTFNFREFILNSKEENIDFIEAEAFEEELEEKNVHNYGANKKDEDEKSNFDIKAYLKEKGYNTEYLLLTNDEKNNVMLCLMHLKDEKMITKDEYINEVSELWKN